MNTIDIRPLTAADWQMFRAIRLRALATEPGMYGGNHADAAAQPQDWWEGLAQSEASQVFGAWQGATMVGLIGAFAWWEDLDRQTAFIGMLFVDRVMRGRGISTRLLRVALEWSRSRFRSAVVSHRASNLASRAAILRLGFQEAHREPHVWPDGGTEDAVDYVLTL